MLRAMIPEPKRTGLRRVLELIRRPTEVQRIVSDVEDLMSNLEDIRNNHSRRNGRTSRRDTDHHALLFKSATSVGTDSRTCTL